MTSPNISFNIGYVYKKIMCEMWKKVIDYCEKIVFETFLSNLFSKLPTICENNIRKTLFQSAKKIPQNYLKIKLFNIDADRRNAPK